jgi:hypothetical protein
MCVVLFCRIDFNDEVPMLYRCIWTSCFCARLFHEMFLVTATKFQNSNLCLNGVKPDNTLHNLCMQTHDLNMRNVSQLSMITLGAFLTLHHYCLELPV